MLKTNSKIFMVFSITIIILLAASLVLFGCKQETTATAEATTEEAAEAMQFDGQELLISGSTTLLPLAEPASAAFMEKFGGSITIAGGGSGTGISECINGINDIGDASRQAKDKEKDQASEAGIELVEVTVAYDGISVIGKER